MTIRKLPFWATLLTLIGVIILCGLGTWQIQRLHWKQGLLADIEQAYQVDAEKYLIGSDEIMTAWSEDRLALRGTAVGRYLKRSFKLGPRTYNGKSGFHLYSPFLLLDGGTVLVNRGWIPADANMPPPPSGSQRVTGILRTPDTPNEFTPLNRPADNEWYTIDFAQLAKEKNLANLAPYILYIEGPDTGTFPVPVGKKPELFNNHQSYAIFWFMMAGLMIVIYVLRFIVPARARQ